MEISQRKTNTSYDITYEWKSNQWIKTKKKPMDIESKLVVTSRKREGGQKGVGKKKGYYRITWSHMCETSEIVKH